MTNHQDGNSERFREMVDELVLYAENNDPELAEGLRWLDVTEKYGTGLNFYQRVYQCLHKHDIEEKAKNWNEERK